MVDRRETVDFCQRTALLVVAAIPLIPRPTFGGPTDVLAPLAVLAVLYLTFLYAASSTTADLTVLRSSLTGLVLLGVAGYAARVVWLEEASEYLQLLSRILLVVLIVCVTVLLMDGGYEFVMPWFIRSVIVLGMLVLIIGIFGITVLEPPAPARTLGVTFPWHKTAGVPRSFGEQGIIVTMALAYLCAYWRVTPRVTRYALAGAIVAITVVGQSRNVLLGVCGVLLAWFLVISRRRWRAAPIALALAFLATVVVERALPVASNTALGRAAVGEGIYQEYVEARFSLTASAVDLISREPGRFVFGWPHLAWTELTGAEATLHNHILATLIFTGAVAGALTLWAFFVAPLARILALAARACTPDQERRAQFVTASAVGVLISINFYEGFFSPALGLFVALAWSCRFTLVEGTPARGAPAPSATRTSPRVGGTTDARNR